MEGLKDPRRLRSKREKKKYSLLYVDDEATNLRVFKANFRKFYNVFVTTSPLEAIDILKQEDIQIIVTDQRMPEMTGTEFLEKILPDHPDAIKIILTGFTDIEAIKDGINRCGIYKYITKPWVFDEMKGVLERGIELYTKAAESEEHIKELEVSNTELEQKVQERTEELNKINKRLIDSIRYAGMLQKSMLPNERFLRRQFSDHFMIFETKYHFSEEFIWTTRLNFRSEDYTIVSLIEFDGKGIVGSLKTLIADSVLSYLTQDRKIFHSAEIIKELKFELDAAGSEELKCDIKVAVAVFDHYSNVLQFSGVEQDMMIFNGKKLDLLKGDRGMDVDEVGYKKMEIQEGSAYYIYSKGFYNQKNEDGVRFSYEKFEEMLKAVQGRKMSEQKEFIISNLEAWKADQAMSDDISILGFKL